VTAKYDIKALIGRGTFSRVVRVEHRITRQPYAIKMVDRNRGREMCEAELVVLRRVRHSYIIRLIEVRCHITCDLKHIVCMPIISLFFEVEKEQN